MNIIRGLNEAQKKAVTTTEGPLMIIAGPGTGKTHTIVHRIANLIYEQEAAPEQILAITFTNRAAKEMKERTVQLLGVDASGAFIGTFHMLGLKIIQENIPDSFTICNRDEQERIIRELSRKSSRKAKQILEQITRMKNFLDAEDEEIRKLYTGYQQQLERKCALDFDDLILRPISLLGNEEIAAKYRNAFQYIMVDEYQDINTAQYRLLKLLAGEHENICVIGDADQAIYAFRGSDVSNYLQFKTDFSNARSITLSDNYRSTGCILNAADILVQNNLRRIKRDLFSTRTQGTPVTTVSVPDERAEGEYIIRELETRIGGTSNYHVYRTGREYRNEDSSSYSFSDFAVLYRTNAQAKIIGDIFARAGIPCQIVGRNTLLHNQALTDTLMLLNIVLEREDGKQLSGMLSRNLTGDKVKRFRLLKESMPLEEFLRVIFSESGLKACYGEAQFIFVEHLSALYRTMDMTSAIRNLLDELTLLSPGDEYNGQTDSVSLMTLHMAKGLEFKVVFITGVEEGLIPYVKDGSCDKEEERRLLYVGMTRACDELFLLHARKRFLYGQTYCPTPSSFLDEIPQKLRNHMSVPDRKKEREKEKQRELF